MRADSELDVPGQIEALWGTRTLPRDAGVLHVVATWFDGGQHRVIRITPQGPKSDTDFFLLNLARARADLILTTGRILREEPSLAYSLPETWAASMLRWRAEALRRTEAPRVAVLTSGRGLDPDHPALHGWARPVIVTSDDASRAVRDRMPSHVDVIGLQSTEPRAVLEWARHSGARTISVEAGPSTACALYADPVAIDELSWSEFLEPDLPHDLQGPAVFSPGPDAEGMRLVGSATTLHERSGRWRFSRWHRRFVASDTSAPAGRAG